MASLLEAGVGTGAYVRSGSELGIRRMDRNWILTGGRRKRWPGAFLSIGFLRVRFDRGTGLIPAADSDS